MKKVILYFRRFPVSLAAKLTLFGVFKKILNSKGILFYSQLGEDQYIDTLLRNCLDREGFYIDIGCNDPIRFSNTFGLYCKGWRGICIDANPELAAAFKRIRKKDWVLQDAISDEEKEVDFCISDTHLASSLDASFLKDVWSRENYSLRTTKKVRTKTLDHVLDEFTRQGNGALLENIDLLSIDVEGHDFNVLRSIDLRKYRPKLIVVEMHGFDQEHLQSDPICQYLAERDYVMAGYHILNGFFLAGEFVGRSAPATKAGKTPNVLPLRPQ